MINHNSFIYYNCGKSRNKGDEYMYVEDPEVSAFLKHIHIQSIPAKIPVTVSNPFTVCHMLTDGKGMRAAYQSKFNLLKKTHRVDVLVSMLYIT